MGTLGSSIGRERRENRRETQIDEWDKAPPTVYSTPNLRGGKEGGGLRGKVSAGKKKKGKRAEQEGVNTIPETQTNLVVSHPEKEKKTKERETQRIRGGGEDNQGSKRGEELGMTEGPSSQEGTKLHYSCKTKKEEKGGLGVHEQGKI